jgi:hypothetical protein
VTTGHSGFAGVASTRSLFALDRSGRRSMGSMRHLRTQIPADQKIKTAIPSRLGERERHGLNVTVGA